MRYKPSDFFVTASLKLSAHTLAQNYSQPRANRSRGSNGSDTCVSNKVERKIQIHVVAKGTRIDRAFAHSFWQVHMVEHQKHLSSVAPNNNLATIAP